MRKDKNVLEDYMKSKKLINEFRIGKLRKYRSERVALHETTYQTILDYMRDIVWE